MHKFVRLALGALITVTAAAGSAPAQTAQQFENLAGALALELTPPAGLSQLVTRAMIGGPKSQGPQLGIRYGHTGLSTDPSGGGVTVNNYAATGLFPMSDAGTLFGTVGFTDADCDGCKTHVMLSGGGDVALGSRPLGTDANSARMTFTLGGELGWSDQENGYAVGGLVSLPVALVFTNGSLKVAPFLTPAYGYGRAHDSEATAGDQDQSAGRFVLGGGLAVVDVNSIIGVTLGFQKVFVSETFNAPIIGSVKVKSKTLFGVGVTIGR